VPVRQVARRHERAAHHRVVAGGFRILRNPVDTEGRAPPKLLSADIVDELRARVDAGDFDLVARPAPGKTPRRIDIKAGDQVRAAGAVGELVRLDENGRAELLQQWLGSERRVTVDARHLELAAG
jgi:hypothetical protein